MLVLVVSAGFALAAAVIIYQRVATPGRTAFVLLMLAVAEWEVARVFEGAAIGMSAKILWAKLEYVGIASVPPLWFLLAWAYSVRSTPVPRWARGGLWLIPVVTVALAWSNEQHRLVWSAITSSSPSPGAHLLYQHGRWFWVAAAYNYVLVLAGSVVLVGAFVRFPPYYRRQTGILLGGAAIPWAGNALYLLGLSPVPGLDPTPFAFTLAGLLWCGALVRLPFLDIVPVARARLIERMTDGILVIDQAGRIVDSNPAVGRLLGSAAIAPVGKAVSEVLGASPELAALATERDAQLVDVWCPTLRLYLDVRRTSLPSPDGRVHGHLLVLRDITARKDGEARLQEQLRENAALQARLREEAIRDPLTGLFNRRYLQETLDREIARATREGRTLGVTLLDIDHFKAINDAHGHAAGDRVLRALGDILQADTRGGDIACRYGGEEFVVVSPGASTEEARQRAEQWRAALSASPVPFGAVDLHATVSVGVAAWPTHGDDRGAVLQAADHAMYAAKAHGRNCVVVSDTVVLGGSPRP